VTLLIKRNPLLIFNLIYMKAPGKSPETTLAAFLGATALVFSSCGIGDCIGRASRADELANERIAYEQVMQETVRDLSKCTSSKAYCGRDLRICDEEVKPLTLTELGDHWEMCKLGQYVPVTSPETDCRRAEITAKIPGIFIDSCTRVQNDTRFELTDHTVRTLEPINGTARRIMDDHLGHLILPSQCYDTMVKYSPGLMPYFAGYEVTQSTVD
jgi:hypothetical protein